MFWRLVDIKQSLFLPKLPTYHHVGLKLSPRRHLSRLLDLLTSRQFSLLGRWVKHARGHGRVTATSQNDWSRQTFNPRGLSGTVLGARDDGEVSHCAGPRVRALIVAGRYSPLMSSGFWPSLCNIFSTQRGPGVGVKAIPCRQLGINTSNWSHAMLKMTKNAFDLDNDR